MLIRVAIFATILALPTFYAGWGVISRWPWAAAHPVLSYGTVLLLLVLQLVGPLGDRRLFQRWRNRPGMEALQLVLNLINPRGPVRCPNQLVQTIP